MSFWAYLVGGGLLTAAVSALVYVVRRSTRREVTAEQANAAVKAQQRASEVLAKPRTRKRTVNKLRSGDF